MKTAFLRSFILGAASILLVAATISCGRTHHQSNLSDQVVPAKSQSRIVSLADILRQIDAYPTPKGVDAARFASLKAELKRQLAARSADGKHLSIAPTATANAVTDLKAVADPSGAQATVTWTERLWGDYDNNGVVDIGDLIPLALYYGQRTDSGPNDAHRLVNGDADPEINIWDLGAIAGNYAAHLEGYQVWRGHWNGSSTDWETTYLPNTGNPTNTNWSADRPSPPPVSTRPAYTYADGISGVSDKNNIRYKVVPFGDGGTGPESNEAPMPPPGTYLVKGTVTSLTGGTVGAVTMMLTPGNLQALTQPDGKFTFVGVSPGAYTLTPIRAGYTFTPASRTVAVTNADVVGQDFIATAIGLADTPWPKANADAQNSGLSRYVGPQTNALKWFRDLPPPVYPYNVASTPPVVGAGGTVYVCSYSNTLYAFDGESGAIKWQSALLPSTSSLLTPAIGGDGSIFVADKGGNINCFDSLTGAARWRRATPLSITTDLSVGNDGALYLGTSYGEVVALNPADGGMKWRASIGVQVYVIAVGGDGTVYAGTNKQTKALSPLDGGFKWTSDAGRVAAVGPEGTVYALLNATVSALSPANGSVKWSRAVSGYGVDIALGPEGTICLLAGQTSAPSVILINQSDGSIRWESLQSGKQWQNVGQPVVGADGTIYFWAYPYGISSIRFVDGSTLWSYPVNGSNSVSGALGANGTLYVITDIPGLYAFGSGGAKHNVTGRVTLGGAGLKDVVVTLSPNGSSTITQPDGTFIIAGAVNSTYILSAFSESYTFSPFSRRVTVSGEDVSGQDFAAIKAGLANTPWPKFRHDVLNTGLSPYVGARTNAVKWAAPLGYAVDASPTISADGAIYVSDQYGYVNALNRADGSVVWRQFISAYVGSAAIGTDGRVYITGGNDCPFALDPASGAVIWISYLGGGGPTAGGSLSGVSSPTLSTDGSVYLGSAEVNGLRVLNMCDGSTGFHYGDAVSSCPALTQRGAYAFARFSLPGGGYAAGSYSFNIGIGASLLSSSVNLPFSSPAVSSDGTAYFAGADGYLSAVNPANQTVKWTCPTGNGYLPGFYGLPASSSPAVGPDGTVYVGSTDDSVYAIDPAVGIVKWKTPTGGPILSSPAVGADGTIYIGSDDHRIYALRPTDGVPLWTYATGGPVLSSPAIDSDGTVYVGSEDGNVYAFGGSGASTWSIIGSVTYLGAGVAGVKVGVLPLGVWTTTRADGNYEIDGIPNGSYTLQAEKWTYGFTPPTRDVTVSGATVSGQDFTVSSSPYSVSGTVTAAGVGLGGVVLTLVPGGPTGTTGNDGTYSIPNVPYGTYTITSYLAGYTPTPAFRVATVSTSDVSGQDFAMQPAAGLASSAWPKYHQNARNTGQSLYIGPQTSHARWIAPVTSSESPAVGADGTIYVSGGLTDLSLAGLLALNPSDGSVRWCSEGEAAPSIGADGTIYVGLNGFWDKPDTMCAVNPYDGSIRWTSVGGSPVAIGGDGTLYVGTWKSGAYALNPSDGGVKWHSSVQWGIDSCPAIGSDGTVYVASYDSLSALSPADGSVKWVMQRGISLVNSPPALADDGTIYISGGGFVYAVSPSDGSVKWRFPANPSSDYKCAPVVGANGTVYVGDSSIYALNSSDGSLKWKYAVGDSVRGGAVGADGTVYVANYSTLYALRDTDGALLWKLNAGSAAPAMGSDGTLYVCGDYLYAFGP